MFFLTTTLSSIVGRTMDQLASQIKAKDITATMQDIWLQLTRLPELLVNKHVPDTATWDIAQQTYHDTIIWTASATAQCHYLYMDQKIKLTPPQQAVLEYIGAAGPQGIQQCLLSKALQLKPQLIFHYLKRLQTKDLIVKTPSIYRGQFTNTCIHRRYVSSSVSRLAPLDMATVDDQGNIRYDVTVAKINHQLAQAKDQTMAMTDLIRASGLSTEQHIRWARRFLNTLYEEGFVEKVISTANDTNLMCIRRLKDIPPNAFDQIHAKKCNTLDTSDQTSGSNQTMPEKSNPPSRPLEDNDLITFVLNQAERGATNKDIQQAFIGHPPYHVQEITKKIRDADPSVWVTIRDVQGRSTVYRYFDKAAYASYQAHTNPGWATSVPTPASTSTNSDTNDSQDTNKRVAAQAFDPGLPTGATSPAKKKPRQKRTVNGRSQITELRMQALQFIIDRDQVRDFNQSLFDEIQQTASLDPQLRQKKLSRDTADRVIDHLITSGTAQLLKIAFRTLGGAVVMRTLAMKPGMTEKDPVVQAYLHQQQTSALERQRTKFTPNHQQMDALRRIDAPVDRPIGPITDDCTPATSAIPSPSTASPPPTASPAAPSSTTSSAESSADSLEARPDADRSQLDFLFLARHRRSVAIRHGWIESKWLRARDLHLYLFQRQLDHHPATSQADKEEEQPILLSTLLNDMPLSLFVRIIGIHRPTDAVEQFMVTNTDAAIPTHALPDHVRRDILISVSSFRNRLVALLDILMALGVVQQRQRTSTASRLGYVLDTSEPMYWCMAQGAICDFSQATRPVLSTLPLQTVEHVSAFWKELQYLCTCVHANDSQTSTVAHLGRRQRKALGYTLATITRPSTWVTGCNGKGIDEEQHISQRLSSDPLTAEQKRILDQHVDYRHQCIRASLPHHDWALCRHLARETGLLPLRVRSYYINLELAFAKRNHRPERLRDPPGTAQRKPKPPPVPKAKVPQAIQDLLQAAKQNQSIARSPIPQQPTGPKRPVLFDRRAVVQTRFDAMDNDVFLHALAIMRWRSRFGKFYWKPILQVLPNKTSQQCRDHLKNLKDVQSVHLDKLIQLEMIWSQELYPRATEEHAFLDPKPWDTLSYDLASQVEYFLKQRITLTSEPSYVTWIDIQHDMTSILAQYDVRRSRRQRLYQGRPTNVERHSRLFTSSLPVFSLLSRTTGTSLAGPHPTNTSQIRLQTLVDVIKMVTMLPEEAFDPHLSYRLLSQYSSEEVEHGYQVLTSERFLAISKHDPRQRVPGRSYRVSSKYLSCLEGPVEKALMDRALDYRRQLGDGQTLPSELDAGAEFCLLDLASQHKILFTFQDGQAWTEHVSGAVYPNPLTEPESNVQDWLCEKEVIDVHVDTSDMPTAPPEPTAPKPIVLLTLAQVDALLSAAHPTTRNVLWQVYRAVATFGDQGTTPLALKAVLHEVQSASMNEEELSYHLDTLEKLQVILKVGREERRWVSIENARDWLVQLDGGQGSFVQPRAWLNLAGQAGPMQSLVDHGILGHIVQQPGVSQVRKKN
ncbi:hypothetical protein DM01DRAFT_1013148 [Hesseltinella vesiculosa]|uniref:HTH myb-type domain-containing protein n=1 Tax=Hesseltinella vesiculosa TaxID=101127 RepID=A0A1X2GYR1_9FUNG|nr:hypothetical protein DM01DRAFT_1013148 [Hesseltinella vesiculosa]